jgi:hypothetical protein
VTYSHICVSFVTAALTGVGTSMLPVKDVAPEVRTERLVLCDKDGQEAATLLTNDGATWLTLRAPAKGTAIVLGCLNDGQVEINARGLDGTVRMSIGSNGLPTAMMNHLKQSAIIALRPESEFEFSVEDARGDRRATLSLKNDKVVLEALDQGERLRWRLPPES